jgi:hypothetical protein
MLRLLSFVVDRATEAVMRLLTIALLLCFEMIPRVASAQPAADTGATFTYLSGPSFCVNNFGYTVPAFCTAPGELPLGSLPLPPRGGSYMDANFGARVRLLTDETADMIHQYSTPSAFSATGKYIFMATMDGHTRIVNAVTSDAVVPDLAGVFDVWSGFWSAIDDDVLYGIGTSWARTQIIKYQVSTRQKTTLVDYAADGHHFTSISAGGTGDLSADNWAAFFSENEHQVCAVDLNLIKTYCADYKAANPGSRVGWDFVDYVMITRGKDIDTNKRYVLLMATPAMAVYSVNESTGALDFEYRGPEIPAGMMGGDTPGVGNKDGICDPGEQCFGAPHADVFAENGRQYIFVDAGIDQPACEDDLVSLQISKGLKLLAPVESGGGRKVITTLFKCGLNWPSPHFGCARSSSAYCVVSLDTNQPNLPKQVRDGRTPFDSEVMVVRGNGDEIRRLAMHRSVQTQFWDQPRACISPDGSKVLWDSNFGNPARHRIAVVDTGFSPRGSAARNQLQ